MVRSSGTSTITASSGRIQVGWMAPILPKFLAFEIVPHSKCVRTAISVGILMSIRAVSGVRKYPTTKRVVVFIPSCFILQIEANRLVLRRLSAATLAPFRSAATGGKHPSNTIRISSPIPADFWTDLVDRQVCHRVFTTTTTTTTTTTDGLRK